MRGLFLSIILLLSSAIQADPIMITTPYHPVLADQLTMQDDALCRKQAQISAKALQNAVKLGISLDEQLKVWDEFTESDAADEYSKEELATQRELISMAWIMAETYPDLKPNEYGDYIYSSCAFDKINDPKVKF